MTTPAAHTEHDTTPEGTLCVACELPENTWKLGVTIGHGHKPYERSIPIFTSPPTRFRQ